MYHDSGQFNKEWPTGLPLQPTSLPRVTYRECSRPLLRFEEDLSYNEIPVHGPRELSWMPEFEVPCFSCRETAEDLVEFWTSPLNRICLLGLAGFLLWIYHGNTQRHVRKNLERF